MKTKGKRNVLVWLGRNLENALRKQSARHRKAMVPVNSRWRVQNQKEDGAKGSNKEKIWETTLSGL